VEGLETLRLVLPASRRVAGPLNDVRLCPTRRAEHSGFGESGWRCLLRMNLDLLQAVWKMKQALCFQQDGWDIAGATPVLRGVSVLGGRGHPLGKLIAHFLGPVRQTGIVELATSPCHPLYPSGVPLRT